MRLLIRTRQLAALPANERRLLLLALVLVAHARAALCLLPSRTSLRLVRRLSEVRPRPRDAHALAPSRIAWAIASASRLVPRATCLTQAIAGTLLLRFYGYESRLCLGVARASTGKFAAHAWVERDDRVLIGGAQSAAFTRLPSLDASFRHNAPIGTR